MKFVMKFKIRQKFAVNGAISYFKFAGNGAISHFKFAGNGKYLLTFALNSNNYGKQNI